jgi:hypothetical protein
MNDSAFVAMFVGDVVPFSTAIEVPKKSRTLGRSSSSDASQRLSLCGFVRGCPVILSAIACGC